MLNNLILKKLIKYDDAGNFFKKIKKKKSIIQCHGVFDIVHPGHIRHFSHCRSKADILVVSITPDIFIKKGTYRPLVPEKIRANSLAALEFIDFVVIDKNPQPYKLLRIIKPNYFAKGMEYFLQKNSLTEKETKIIEKYGGKMIFSPGDYVLSSSRIINQIKPSLKYEKLKTLMDTENVTFLELKKILNKLSSIKVHILGDTIIDINHSCEVIGGLHKTPTLSIAKAKSTNYLGGAAVIASHFKAFAKDVTLTTMFSNDDAGKFANHKLKKLRIQFNQIFEIDRPTTIKNSYLVDRHKLLKVDEVSNAIILNSNIEKIEKIFIKERNKIVVFADFRHGLFNAFTSSKFVKSIHSSCFKVADSQVASRWGNILDFKKFDLITPTEREARYSLFEQDLPIRTLADLLLTKSQAKNLILKLGSKGLISLNKKREDYITLDPFVNNLIDSNGAGDALLAYSTPTLYLTKSLILSSIIGIIAASCKCELEGNVPIHIENVINKINEIEKIFL